MPGSGRWARIAGRPTRSWPPSGWIGFGLRIWQLLDIRVFQFEQATDVFTRGPGLWVTGIGLVMLARAAYDIFREPPGR